MNLTNNKPCTIYEHKLAATNVVSACKYVAELRCIVCFVGTLCRYKKYPFCSAEQNQLLYINKLYRNSCMPSQIGDQQQCTVHARMCKQNNEVINKEFGKQRVRIRYYCSQGSLYLLASRPSVCFGLYVCVCSLASEKLDKVNYVISKLKLGQL